MGEDEIVECNVDVVEDGLSRESAVEGEDELRDREEHVFVEKVEDGDEEQH